MGKFEAKIKKMEDKLAYLQHYYGYNDRKAQILREKLELYKIVEKMSHAQVGENITCAAGEIEKLKSGYYSSATSVDSAKKLLNVLRERIKSDKKDAEDERKKINNTDLDMLGCTIDDKKKGGFTSD